MSDVKTARAAHPVHELIAGRWSPYVFDTRPVSEEDLGSLLEAARWAASSYNEQPWRFLIATREHPEEFEGMLACLVDANREWARSAPVLALGVVSTRFARNSSPNRAAEHDLGLATANLMLEATHRGLCIHPMIGIHPDRARESYKVPEGFEVLTALAIGYLGGGEDAPEALRARDATPRTRRAVEEFAFTGSWGRPLFGGEAR